VYAAVMLVRRRLRRSQRQYGRWLIDEYDVDLPWGSQSRNTML
jgi:hypothetical protein